MALILVAAFIMLSFTKEEEVCINTDLVTFVRSEAYVPVVNSLSTLMLFPQNISTKKKEKNEKSGEYISYASSICCYLLK